MQIQRMLGLGSYRSALFMMHRIRYALKHPSFATKLTGVVEMDETYVGGKYRHGKGTGKDNKVPVVALVQRGGDVRSMVIERVTGENLKAAIREHVEVGSIVCTDDSTPTAQCRRFSRTRPLSMVRKNMCAASGISAFTPTPLRAISRC